MMARDSVGSRLTSSGALEAWDEDDEDDEEIGSSWNAWAAINSNAVVASPHAPSCRARRDALVMSRGQNCFGIA